MTVEELIEQLKQHHPDSEVRVIAEGESSRAVTDVGLDDNILFTFIYVES